VTVVAPTWVAVDRDVVAVTGADARSYLHGQVSQNVATLAAGASRWTLVLAPNGRVDALARVRCVADDRFELDIEPGFGAGLAARLDRFRIRVKAELDIGMTRLVANIGELSQQEPVATAHQSSVVGWWDTGSWLAVQPAGAEVGTIDDYERARVARGWPAMGSEIAPGERIPAEIAVVPVAVDFTKGCYPGQELVERMDSRGSQAPRQLRIVSAAEAAELGEDGQVTSVAGDLALAYVKRGAGAGVAPGPSSA
jgi:folate-binding protein YgfZ